MTPLFKNVTLDNALTAGLNAVIIYVWGILSLATAIYGYWLWEDYSKALERRESIEAFQFEGRMHHIQNSKLSMCYVLEDVKNDNFYVNDEEGSACDRAARTFITNGTWYKHVQYRESEAFDFILAGVATVFVLLMMYPFAILLSTVICFIWTPATQYIYWMAGALLLIPLYFVLSLTVLSFNPVAEMWTYNGRENITTGEIKYVCVTDNLVYNCPPAGFFNWADSTAGAEIGVHGFTGEFK